MNHAVVPGPVRWFWSLCLLLSLTALSGCGYHLRGVTALDSAYQRVYVQGMNSANPVYRELARQFANTDSKLVDSPANATAILVIDNNRVHQWSSVVSTQATVRQYELYQQLTWHVRLPNGHTSAKRTISQARNYNYDPTGVLASGRNQVQVRSELAETVGRLLFYGLRAPVRASKPTDGAQ